MCHLLNRRRAVRPPPPPTSATQAHRLLIHTHAQTICKFLQSWDGRRCVSVPSPSLLVPCVLSSLCEPPPVCPSALVAAAVILARLTSSVCGFPMVSGSSEMGGLFLTRSAGDSIDPPICRSLTGREGRIRTYSHTDRGWLDGWLADLLLCTLHCCDGLLCLPAWKLSHASLSLSLRQSCHLWVALRRHSLFPVLMY